MGSVLSDIRSKVPAASTLRVGERRDRDLNSGRGKRGIDRDARRGGDQHIFQAVTDAQKSRSNGFSRVEGGLRLQ